MAFLGTGADGQTGIYELTGSQLRRVISVGEAVEGKVITGLNFFREGFSDGHVAFQATFGDGSQGVFTIEVTLPAELRIIALEKLGNDLRLSFTSVAGQNYIIQSRADLGSGTWTDLPGTSASGTGQTIEVVLTSLLGQRQQFYRVQVVP